MIIKCCWLQVYFWSFLDWLSDFLYCPSFTIIWSNLYAIFLFVFLVFSFVLSFNSIFLIVFIANNLFFYSFLFSLSFSLCHNFFFLFKFNCGWKSNPNFTKQMNVAKDSKVRPFYEKAPFFVNFRIYLFNVTNKNEVLQGSESNLKL